MRRFKYLIFLLFPFLFDGCKYIECNYSDNVDKITSEDHPVKYSIDDYQCEKIFQKRIVFEVSHECKLLDNLELVISIGGEIYRGPYVESLPLIISFCQGDILSYQRPIYFRVYDYEKGLIYLWDNKEVYYLNDANVVKIKLLKFSSFDDSRYEIEII